MKHFTLSALLATVVLAAVAYAGPETDLVGKTVMIKTSKEGTACITNEKSVPKIATYNKSSPEKYLFKVSAGTAAGTVMFESASEAGLFLNNAGHHLALINVKDPNSTFRIVAPLRGNLGNAIQSFSYPQFHVIVNDKDKIDFTNETKDPRKMTFFVQEPPAAK